VRRPLIFLCAALACVRLTLAAQSPAVITFVHINDVYEIEPIEGGKFGGLARVATLLARTKRAGGPVIMTLGGDFLSPSAISWARVDGEPMAAKQMVAVLNALGLDWATLGNHEFDVGEATFRTRMAEAKFKVISSNVTGASGQPLPGVLPTAIVPVKTAARTIRLGVIGLTLDLNRQPWVKYAPPIDAAKAAIAGFAGRTDAIVALTHLQMASDADLVEAIPEIDLVLGGHEHENWLARRGDRFTPIVKADANARSAAVVTLTFGAPRSRPRVGVRFESLDTTVPEDARVRTEVRTWMNKGYDAFRREGFNPDEVIGQAREPLDGRSTTVRFRPSTLTDLILAAMSGETGAPLAILNGGSLRIDDVVLPGPVRQYDVMRIVPFGGKVVSAALDGAVLAQVLDAGVANNGSGGVLHWRGITRQDKAWLVDGKPLDSAARYVVAMPEFLLTGLESRMDFLTRTNPGVRDVREFKDLRFVVMDEIRRRQP
jgi:5'-nucleotidase/UDP-sugar diphosphatase